MRRIYQILIKLLPSKLQVQWFLKRNRNKNIFGGASFDIELKKSFDTFLTSDEICDKEIVRKYTFDIAFSYLNYGATPTEYFLFKFNQLSQSRRESMLTNIHKDKCLLKKVGYEKYVHELRDKFLFYQRYKKFFKREVCRICCANDFEEYKSFALKYPSHFVKPLDGMCGEGAKKVYVHEGIKSKFENLLK